MTGAEQPLILPCRRHGAHHRHYEHPRADAADKQARLTRYADEAAGASDAPLLVKCLVPLTPPRQCEKNTQAALMAPYQMNLSPHREIANNIHDTHEPGRMPHCMRVKKECTV